MVSFYIKRFNFEITFVFVVEPQNSTKDSVKVVELYVKFFDKNFCFKTNFGFFRLVAN